MSILKPKGFALVLIILVIAIVGVGGYFGYKYFKSNYVPINQAPSTTTSPATDATADWKIYTNSVENFSFKYPSTWTIDTSGEKGDEGSENIQVKLTKNQAKIQIWANMVGIGGMGQDYQGTPVTFAGTNLYRYKVIGADDKTVIVGLTDQLTESLGVFQINKKTYSFSLEYPKALAEAQAQELENEFDLIITTFKFSDQASASGTVSGKLCYPSDFLPPGEIIAKNITTGKLTTTQYPGSMNGGASTYTIELPAGNYHLKYQAHASTSKPDIFTSGYYDECAKTMHTNECTPDSGHINISVMVTTGQTIDKIDLCDFYASETQQQYLNNTF